MMLYGGAFFDMTPKQYSRSGLDSNCSARRMSSFIFSWSSWNTQTPLFVRDIQTLPVGLYWGVRNKCRGRHILLNIFLVMCRKIVKYKAVSICLFMLVIVLACRYIEEREFLTQCFVYCCSVDAKFGYVGPVIGIAWNEFPVIWLLPVQGVGGARSSGTLAYRFPQLL